MKTLKQTTVGLLMCLSIIGMTSLSSCSKDSKGGGANPIPAPATDLVLNVKTPGTLAQEIKKAGTTDYLTIQKLTLSGTLNSADVLCLRQMAGDGKTKEETTKGKLNNLDISKVKFTKDEKEFYTSGDTKHAIDNTNAVPGFMFTNCNALKVISLPTSVSALEASAFNGCSSLEAINIPATVKSIGDATFADCTSLLKVTMNTVDLAKTPMTLGKDIFKNIAKGATLFVPKDEVTNYQNSPLKDYFVDSIKAQPEVNPSDDSKKKPEVNPSDDSKKKPEVNPSDDSKKKPEVNPSDDSKKKPEVNPSDDSKKKPEVKPSDDSKKKPEVKPSDDSKKKPEVNPSDDSKKKPEVKPSDDSKKKPEVKPSDDSKKKSDVKPSDDSKAKSDADSDVEPEA